MTSPWRLPLTVLGGVIVTLLAFAAVQKVKAETAAKPAVTRAQAAAAAPASPWTGCYVGAHGGLAAMDTKAGVSYATNPVNPLTNGTLLELDGISSTGHLYGVGVGCDIQLAKSFVLGVFADYSKHGGDGWNLNIGPSFPGAVNFTTALDREWSIGVRAGYLPSASWLVYGLVAYSRLDMEDFSGSVGGVAFPTSLAVPTFTGWQVGGGVEHRINGGPWSIKGEYRYGFYEAESANIATNLAGTQSLNLDVDPTVHTVRLGLSYKFGALPQ